MPFLRYEIQCVTLNSATSGTHFVLYCNCNISVLQNSRNTSPHHNNRNQARVTVSKSLNIFKYNFPTHVDLQPQIANYKTQSCRTEF